MRIHRGGRLDWGKYSGLGEEFRKKTALPNEYGFAVFGGKKRRSTIASRIGRATIHMSVRQQL